MQYFVTLCQNETSTLIYPLPIFSIINLGLLYGGTWYLLYKSNCHDGNTYNIVERQAVHPDVLGTVPKCGIIKKLTRNGYSRVYKNLN